jgi:hypothetical protein
MTYAPNFNDPRVISRITHALGFSLAVMSTDKEHPWSTRVIDKYFGSQRNDLSKYLRSTLLICTNQRYNKDTGECKSYKLNQLGVDYLKQVLTNSMGSNDSKESNGMSKNHYNNSLLILYPSVVEVGSPQFDQLVVASFVHKEYHNELNSGKFEYTEKSSRLWHSFQSVRSVHRKPILANYGYIYEYDIVACAPTLLLQYSRQLGNDIWLPRIHEYLENRSLVRTRLAKEAELDVKDIKVLINALFCGAKLGCNHSFALSHLLNHDLAKITFLKQDTFLSELKEEIKIMWSYLNQEIPRVKKTDKNGKLRLVPISSRDKWNIYFRLECEVMTSIRKYINTNQLKCFLEHDGWSCQDKINIEQLMIHINNDTGYDVQLEMKINEQPKVISKTHR